MFAWIAENLGTILVTLALIAIVVLILVHLHRERTQGRSSCGGSCSHCAMSKTCHHR